MQGGLPRNSRLTCALYMHDEHDYTRACMIIREYAVPAGGIILYCRSLRRITGVEDRSSPMAPPHHRHPPAKQSPARTSGAASDCWLGALLANALGRGAGRMKTSSRRGQLHGFSCRRVDTGTGRSFVSPMCRLCRLSRPDACAVMSCPGSARLSRRAADDDATGRPRRRPRRRPRPPPPPVSLPADASGSQTGRPS